MGLVLLQVVHPPGRIVSSITIGVAAQLGIAVSVGLERYVMVLPDGAEDGIALWGWIVRARRWSSKPVVSVVEDAGGRWHRVAIDLDAEHLELFVLDQNQADRIRRVVRESVDV